MNKELIKLINDNLDLPIFALVDWEVVCDDCHRWFGKFGNAEIREYSKVASYGYNEQTIVFKDDTEEYENWLLENEFNDSGLYLTEKEAEEKIERLNYRKAIFINVDLPDGL